MDGHFWCLECHLIKLSAFRDEHKSSEIASGLFKYQDLSTLMNFLVPWLLETSVYVVFGLFSLF